MKATTRALGLVGAVALLGMMTSCATPPRLPASASTTELASAYSSCAYEVETSIDAIGHIAATQEWLLLDDIVAAQRRPDGERHTLPATVIDEDQREHEVLIHTSYWPGIDWALEAGGKVWLALADQEEYQPGTVDYVLILTSDGNAFFPGDCQDLLLHVPARAWLGGDADDVLAALPHSSPDEVRELLRMPKDEPGEFEVVILNPQDVDEAVLEQLTPVEVTLQTTSVVGEGVLTICTRIEAGWNDCARADDITATEGVSIGAYIDERRVLEFWILNEHGDASSPLAKIGEIAVEDGEESVTVMVDTRSISESGETKEDNLVTVLD